MSEKKKPTGFIARCQCGVIVGAMDYTRMDRTEAGKELGRWIADGCTVEPRFTGMWSETVMTCRCGSGPRTAPDTVSGERLAAYLVAAGIVQEGAVQDPHAYDNSKTLDAIYRVAERLSV